MTSRSEPKAVGDNVLQEALEREAATREILEVISRSRDDEQPVLEVILDNAKRLCQATMASVVLGREGGGNQVLAAHSGATDATVELYRAGRFPMDPTVSYAAQAIIERQAIHIENLADTRLYRDGNPNFRSLVDEQGIRTNLLVPLVSQGEGIGCLILFRQEVRPYSRDQIALVEAFAAQAVIAIENVRQFRELRSRLEREAATREILQVISSSREDEQPVFDVLLKCASRLFSAPMAGLHMVDEARSEIRLVAQVGLKPETLASHNLTLPIDSANTAARAVKECAVFHSPDLADDDLYRSGNPARVAIVDVEGVRSALVVPLISGEVGIGSIWVFRRAVRPYSDDEIALLQSFAAQAVIAIENVRQFRELQTRLEREAATRSILHVISQSRADESPVFDAILDSACRLCEAPHGLLFLVADGGEYFDIRAARGGRAAHTQMFKETPLSLDPTQSVLARCLHKRTVMQVEDLAADQLYHDREPHRVYSVEQEGVRTAIYVPLVRGDEGLGAICLYRREVKPFTQSHIDLIRIFAEQAVIAVENVRQFKALETRTEELHELNANLETRVESQVGEIERMGRLKRFLSPAVADAVVLSGDENLLSSHRALIAVLFCDIRGFTAFCETAEPEETIEVLQTYHEEMGKLINAHGAGVDHRAGDGIMVIFNDPLPCDDPAGDALRMAMAMRDRMAELCKGWRRLGHRLGFGVGISLGYATVGMVGSEGRYDYTASGTAVNLAARLCDEAADGEILLSPRAYAAVEDDFTAESKGEISLKGISAPVEIFRVTLTGTASEEPSAP